MLRAMKLTGLLSVSMIAIGCGGSSPRATTTPKAATCEAAAANNERVILAMGKEQGQDMAAYATAGRETFAEHCGPDAWPQEIITCAAGAADAEAIQACVEGLGPEQHDAMVETFGKKMGGGAPTD